MGSARLILVYGWYGNNNIGDELFKSAFQSLFPNQEFIFTDRLTIELLNKAAAVFIGGGSFLFAEPNIDVGALDLLKSKPIFYIGVGAETEICKTHQELMKIARLVAVRSYLERAQQYNINSILIPDIVFALQSNTSHNGSSKSVLILPNHILVPQYISSHWQHTSWEYFKSEFAQFLDILVEQDHKINFFAMCQNNNSNDDWAAIEIINKMKYRNANYILAQQDKSFNSILNIFSQYSTIITQRYHGIILSEICNIPYLNIHHHDKLKSANPMNGQLLSYYGLSKQELLNKFNLIRSNFTQTIPIESNMFESLKQQVLSHLNT